MDDVMTRPTPDAQKELLAKIRGVETTDLDEDLVPEFS